MGQSDQTQPRPVVPAVASALGRIPGKVMSSTDHSNLSGCVPRRRWARHTGAGTGVPPQREQRAGKPGPKAAVPPDLRQPPETPQSSDGIVSPGAAALLDFLAPGSLVALVSLRGSLCPVTLGHAQGFLEARRLLLGEPSDPSPQAVVEPSHSGVESMEDRTAAGVRRPARLETFAEVLGVLTLNGDRHVQGKLARHGEKHLTYRERRGLVEVATAEYPWLGYARDENATFQALRVRWRELRFVHFTLNGADDVVKYGKFRWPTDSTHRYITMGRPGDTEKVRQGMERANIDPEKGHFILGPELPDISATEAREALRQGNQRMLQELLHPKVIEWCGRNGPYQPREEAGGHASEASDTVGSMAARGKA